ncbi:MAG TPA: condensation domain-containing protein, partial [Pyrinomonadaceae bacterium]
MSTVTQQVNQLSPEEKRALLASLLKKKKAARPKTFPASFAQQRLWFLDRLYGGDPLYNIPFAVRLEGPLDVAALRRALEEVVRRHEALRTTFADVDGRPVQVISPPSALPMPLVDLSGLTPERRESQALRLAAAEGGRLFDLARGPVLRCTLLRLSAEEHVALLTLHHIVSDGWSKDILLREMSTLYGAYAGGEASPLPELPLQYADFAAWQRGWLRGETLEKQLSYWRDHLEGAPPVLELPTDRPRPAFETHRGANHSFRIDAGLYEELKELSRREGATLFMTLLAAFQALLARYSGQSDVVVGTVIAGRNRAETEGLIGFFVNTLALRARVAGDPTFIELLARSRAACLGAYAHQDVPFEKLVEELRPERRLGHTPLFQVTCVLQNTPQSGAELPGVRMRGLGAGVPVAKFDLMLTLVEGGRDLGGSLTYKTDLFDPSTIERMAEHFRVLLAAVVARPGARLSELPLLTDEERRRLLVTFNDTARDYPADGGVHRLFERQAARTPDAPALVCEGETLTYSELNARA